MKNKLPVIFFLVILFSCDFAIYSAAGAVYNNPINNNIAGLAVRNNDKFEDWISSYKAALKSASLEKIKVFYAKDFWNEEAVSLGDSYETGHLKLEEITIEILATNTILVFIPTENLPYSNENDDIYFDFVYRIYRIEKKGDSYEIVKRAMSEINPDFIESKNEFIINPDKNSLYINSVTKIKPASDFILFRMAKELKLDSILINNKIPEYKKLGYIILAKTGGTDTVNLKVKGEIKSPPDNNQFFYCDSINFFLRLGGFAVIPSPPPGNNGRLHFSEDTTIFVNKFILPAKFPLVQYGTILKQDEKDGIKTILAKSSGPWMDNVSFYAQSNWDIRTISTGLSNLTFYFPAVYSKQRDTLIAKINKLLKWAENIFHSVSDPNINFIVLDKFYIGGALNDSYSIIAQNADILLDDTYIHEILHNVPQPHIYGNQLWVKEGFTNFLSFNYLEYLDPERNFWKTQKRNYLHYFNLYEKPLAALVDTRMPTSWAAYQKGPWIYRMLKEAVGSTKFNFLLHNFGKMRGIKVNSIKDYFDIFERTTNTNLSQFESQWLSINSNPVLNVTYLRSPDTGYITQIQFLQKGEVFHLPLEIELHSGNKIIKDAVTINTGRQNYNIPSNLKVNSVVFDPDSKVFAIIRDEIKGFAQPDMLMSIIAGTQRFKSEKSGNILEYTVAESESKITLTLQQGGNTEKLVLDKNQRPLEYSIGEKVIYKINIDSMQIKFSDAEYDIGESIYPRSFIPFLFAMVNWEKTDKADLLYLRDNSKRCTVSEAKKRSVVENLFNIEVGAGSNSQLLIKNGKIIKFIFNGENYIAIK